MSLKIEGAGRKFQMDFSNNALTDRAAIQTSVLNGETGVWVVPNGTSPISSVTLFNKSDVTTSSYANFFINDSKCSISTSGFGGGPSLPLYLEAGGVSASFNPDGRNILGNQSSNSQLIIDSSNGGVVWSGKEVLIQSQNSNQPGIGFHSQAQFSAAVFKWYAAGSHQFQCRNSQDTDFVPISAWSFNISSDYRLKEITGPLLTSGQFIDALNPVQGTWKADGSDFVGFVAHELAEVSPSSVYGEKDAEDDQGNSIYQSVAYSSSEIIANLVAEIQALRKRVAVLEEVV